MIQETEKEIQEILCQITQLDQQHEADLAIVAATIRHLQEDQAPQNVIDELTQKIARYQAELTAKYKQERGLCQIQLADWVELRSTAKNREAELQSQLEQLTNQHNSLTTKPLMTA